MSASEDSALQPVEFDRAYGFTVGGIPVLFGRTAKKATSDPVIFAAALSERDLHRESCGYGATEAEAAADLFRLMRPPSTGGIF